MRMARYHGVRLGIYEDNEAFADWMGNRSASTHLMRRRYSGIIDSADESVGGLVAENAAANGGTTGHSLFVGILTIIAGHVLVKVIDKVWK